MNDTVATDVYWPILAGACVLAAVGSLFTRRQPALWLQFAGAGAGLLVALGTIH